MDFNQSFEDFINVDYHSISHFLFELSGNEFGIIGSIIGYVLCQNLDIDEQNSIGNLFELIGQMMLSIASQNQVRQNDKNQKIRDFYK